MNFKSQIKIVIIVFMLLIITLGLSFSDNDRGIIRRNKRVALLIGNGNYKDSPLKNPINDVNDIAVALKELNFDVIKVINADRIQMRRSIRKFGNIINKGSAVGLFFYAGHGIQVDGINYLVPINTKVYAEDEVEDECLKISSVLRKMETAGNPLNIIILDACRDNPFSRSFRSGERGLAKMDAPTGSILAYATAPGETAADGIARNGLYTSKLLKYIREENLEIGLLFRKVRQDVIQESNNRQVPWESSSLIGEFYFKKKSEITDSINQNSKTNLSLQKLNEIERDNRFILYNNGTVLDTKTNLIWATEDNGMDINWYGAKNFCENYRGGGFKDWRMPTIDELESLYSPNIINSNQPSSDCSGGYHITNFIKLSCGVPWANSLRGAGADCFNFASGKRRWDRPAGAGKRRALPVRRNY